GVQTCALPICWICFKLFWDPSPNDRNMVIIGGTFNSCAGDQPQAHGAFVNTRFHLNRVVQIQCTGEVDHLVCLITHHRHSGLDVCCELYRRLSNGMRAWLIGGGLFKLPLCEQYENRGHGEREKEEAYPPWFQCCAEQLVVTPGRLVRFELQLSESPLCPCTRLTPWRVVTPP